MPRQVEWCPICWDEYAGDTCPVCGDLDATLEVSASFDDDESLAVRSISDSSYEVEATNTGPADHRLPTAGSLRHGGTRQVKGSGSQPFLAMQVQVLRRRPLSEGRQA